MTATQLAPDLDSVFSALAEPTRRRVFQVIVESPGISTSELAERAPSVTRWAVMKHLDVLRAAGLVQTMANGRRRRHYPETSALDPLRHWLDEL